MKNIVLLISLFLLNLSFAQNVILNKVEKTGSNKDKFFYKINPDSVKSEYLGEIEVQGFSADDVAVFNLIYNKAKSVGANAFAYKPFLNIDGDSGSLDPNHYKLSLYEVAEKEIPDNSRSLYILSSSANPQKIGLDGKTVELPPRSFLRKVMSLGQIYTLSTKKFLGSSVKVRADILEGKQFFQMSGFKIRTNPYGTAGINFKSGDILKLEKSYGDFLTTIYEEIMLE